MAYSIDQVEIYRRVANLIDKILRGTNPGDIPFRRARCARRLPCKRGNIDKIQKGIRR
jgi:ABC-type uncharacterized transport system substrate-binding protein